MQNLIDYLGHQLTDSWQVICVEPVFKTALVLPPRGHSDAGEVSGLISLSHCTVFVLVPDECLVEGLTLYTAEAHTPPQTGLLNLLHRKLFDQSYKYGIVHRIT